MAQENWTICPTMISTQHQHLMARISLVSINIVATGGPGAPARYWAHYIWIIELGLVTAQPWPASLLPSLRRELLFRFWPPAALPALPVSAVPDSKQFKLQDSLKICRVHLIFLTSCRPAQREMLHFCVHHNSQVQNINILALRIDLCWNCLRCAWCYVWPGW